MKNNDIIKYRDSIYRVIDVTGDKIFVVDCNKKSTPKWIDMIFLFYHRRNQFYRLFLTLSAISLMLNSVCLSF